MTIRVDLLADSNVTIESGFWKLVNLPTMLNIGRQLYST